MAVPGLDPGTGMATSTMRGHAVARAFFATRKPQKRSVRIQPFAEIFAAADGNWASENRHAQHRDFNSTAAGRSSLAVMPKTARYKHLKRKTTSLYKELPGEDSTLSGPWTNSSIFDDAQVSRRKTTHVIANVPIPVNEAECR